MDKIVAGAAAEAGVEAVTEGSGDAEDDDVMLNASTCPKVRTDICHYL